MHDPVEEVEARDRAGRAAVDRGELVIGNWDDPELLRGETFDVILADYLIGAIDGFSPFTQELTFQRLRRHLAKDVDGLGLEGVRC